VNKPLSVITRINAMICEYMLWVIQKGGKLKTVTNIQLIVQFVIKIPKELEMESRPTEQNRTEQNVLVYIGS
jgi:hypothetical protein